MKITLSELKIKDLATLSQRIIQTSNSGKHPILNNHPLITELTAQYAGYDEVYTKQTFSGKGKDVAVADHERDMAYSSLKAFLNGYRQVASVPNVKDAEDLYQVFVQFGLDLDRLSYSSQTAQMKKLIEALELPANVQKIANLHLSTAFSEMKTKQVYFEEIFQEQAKANAGLRQMPSASSVRRTLENTLRSYINFLTAMKDVAEWKEIYNETNELVKAAKQSSTAKKKEASEPE
ncbi:hypothetical protein SAMN05443633_107188 [Chryseobacterium arachidis]|uniref:Uncharacterized protein n=1 Tax=Chryseobacterium arachidis TaxID=1416778 RepID=A0A1M5F8T7_9FLAO|nr:DUF6261 family protein [Chryseobacterium arachidis]SHF87481.1 hypothetical protein SAMN05443633_107188 [Chryseobacterium arachidis]